LVLLWVSSDDALMAVVGIIALLWEEGSATEWSMGFVRHACDWGWTMKKENIRGMSNFARPNQIH